MAVYTHISDQELADLLKSYNIGNAIKLEAIESGVENTNYFLTTNKAKYVLTIYEKRVKHEDLPFFLGLMRYLSERGVKCPVPIINNSGSAISYIKNKPCAITAFLRGSSAKTISNNHMSSLGEAMANMHLAGNGFGISRQNDFSIACWRDMFSKMHDRMDSFKSGIACEIEEKLKFLSDNWPDNLPKGTIHADLFPDNVFFENNKLAGIIDFYFACNDYFMYDVAICINAWCFEKGDDFNVTKAKILLSSYDKVRKISEDELNALPILASGAALRFLLTRLYDWINRVDGALVTPKDPVEYLKRLRFHWGVKSHLEYGL